VFFVFMPRSLTCGLFSLWCGVWSPRGPQGAADEFHARLDRCLAAKTYAELDELIAALPREEAGRGRGEQSWTWRPWPFPVLLLPIALIAAIASGAHLAWLVLPLLFFFVVRPLLWRTSGGYGRGFWACGPRRTTRV
jgi:hypothetical protein